MSNVIKAYSIRYKEEKKVIDVSGRAEKIDRSRALGAEVSGEGFVGGLNAIALEETGEVSPEQLGAVTAGQDVLQVSAEEIIRRKAELTQQEKEKLRAEFEEEIAAQREQMLLQIQNEANQLMEQAAANAEEEGQRIFQQAHKEGYESGIHAIEQEKARLAEEYEQKDQLRINEFEQMQRDLEPKATQVVIGLISALTGVLLETKKGIVSYLVTKALGESDHSTSFMIRVSKEDYEEVRSNTEKFRNLFEYEVLIEIIQDVLLKKGECMIETDSGIVDCSLGTQMEGLLSDLRLLRV